MFTTEEARSRNTTYQVAKEVPEVTKEAPENMLFLERNNLRGWLLSKEKGFDSNSI